MGFYLSPWDRHDKRYGTADYNVYFKNQLTELLTQYGRVDEVWFDGAKRGKGTPYDWQGFYGVVRNHAPQAVIAIVGPDIRWVGNESGVARVGESSVQKGRQANVHGIHLRSQLGVQQLLQIMKVVLNSVFLHDSLCL